MLRSSLVFSFLLMFSSAFSQMASIELVVKPVPIPTMRNQEVDHWNNSQKGYEALSQQSKEFLYWVNYCRSNPKQFWDSVFLPVANVFPQLSGSDSKSLYQDLVKTGPLPMFSLNSTLIATAQAHAGDIGSSGKPPSHTSTNGTDFGTRMRNARIRACAGENIAVSSQSVLLSVLLLYLDIGLSEKGHRKSLLNANHRETGIGSAPYGKKQIFLVQDLSCSQ
jgi:hypothetical protein